VVRLFRGIAARSEKDPFGLLDAVLDPNERGRSFMSKQTSLRRSVPRIEYLHIRNYRALNDFKLRRLTPLTVFLGPNGSGKSTVFDVFAFLAECFSDGLRKAWDRRGRFRELRTAMWIS
jgi:recombinational DNA repair ATPase RecF